MPADWPQLTAAEIAEDIRELLLDSDAADGGEAALHAESGPSSASAEESGASGETAADWLAAYDRLAALSALLHSVTPLISLAELEGKKLLAAVSAGSVTAAAEAEAALLAQATAEEWAALTTARSDASSLPASVLALRSALATAADRSHYLSSLRSASSAAIVLPAGVSGSADAAGPGAVESKEEEAARLRQDCKDIERDEIMLNGRLLRGKLGYDVILAALQAELDDAACKGLPLRLCCAEEEQLRSLAAHVLAVGNRTTSGGDAFDALMWLASNPELLLVAPDSAHASPIQISVTAGLFHWQQLEAEAEEGEDGDSGTLCWGLRVHVRASTRYKLRDARAETDHTAWAAIRSSYDVRLTLPLYGFPLRGRVLRSAPTVHISVEELFVDCEEEKES
eukprot:PLAT13726.1.p1 GENE.PLAT13726.1~~PLAT13726.1.p1  ORF type:complete len:398 (-),score=120.80 PLAT13726.1:11-1204(-)